MYQFIKKWEEKGIFELEIDLMIFSKEVIMKASFQYLDNAYFFFKKWENHAFIVQGKMKVSQKMDIETLLYEFSDTLLEVELREKIEKQNKVIRESIINAALVWLNTPIVTEWQQSFEPTLDFDKDIESIIKDIENDPELQIDEEEIQKMLDDLQAENESPKSEKIQLTIDKEWIEQAKKNIFKKKSTDES